MTKAQWSDALALLKLHGHAHHHLSFSDRLCKISLSPFCGHLAHHTAMPRHMMITNPQLTHCCNECQLISARLCRPEIVRGSRHGNAVEFLVKFCSSSFIRKRSSNAPRIFHNQFHAIFHQTLCSCECTLFHFAGVRPRDGRSWRDNGQRAKSRRLHVITSV